MKREDVLEQYKWKLEDIFPSNEAWEDAFASFSEKSKSLLDYKGTLGDKAKLKQCLDFSDELDILLEKLYSYAHMRRDENGAIDCYQALCDRIDEASVNYSALCSFISPELCAQSDEYLKSLIEDKDFSDYDYAIEGLLRKKKFVLPASEERILALSKSMSGSFEDIFGKLDYVDLPLPELEIEGKKEKLTQGKYSYYLQNPSVEVRKTVFDGLYETYKKLINTITAIYAGSVKSDNFYAKVRGYESALKKALYEDNIPFGVYDNLISAVSSNLKAVHDYVKLRKNALGGEIHMYDMYVPLTENATKDYDFEQGFSLVLDGLAPLGEEYISLLKKAKAQRWLDVYETENKRTGAYSWGVFGVHPMVLLNHTGTTHDVFTIAHELGHSLHSHYSSSAQPHAKAHYSIFVAEVASTVNEVLLLKHLIEKATDDSEKKYLLSYYLDTFRTTLFRQTMFAEFEKISHDLADEGAPLTPASLSEKYYELNKKYYGESVIHDDYIRYEWARIPHFYNSFYVYKYATGLTAAVNIAGAILREGQPAVERYKKFLQSGSTASPYELLKITGVDLMKKEPFEYAMAEFREILRALEKMTEESK